MDNNVIKERFTYHPPKDDKQIEKYETIRNKALDFALYLNDVCPDSIELISALDFLEIAVMKANASIARHE